MLEKKVVGLLTRNKITFDEINPLHSNERVAVFIIDDKYLLKIFNTEFVNELKQLKRLDHLPQVPKIRYCSEAEDSEDKFMILDFIQGDELFSSLGTLSETTQKEIAHDLFGFLQKLFEAKNTAYDIGHYIPLVPNFAGSWQDGHAEYQRQIKNNIAEIPLQQRSKELIAEAFNYFLENRGSLEFQLGPTLLHNDLHPKNIIIKEGAFSGIIDWECSQFGEPDFELCHVIHWCLFPPDADIKKMTPFTKTLLHAFSAFYQIPDLPIRLTIYQLEHELQKMIWENGRHELERCQRITAWLDGELFALMQ